MDNSMACTLEFILGRAGAGKTQALFERIKAVKETGTAAECIVIVPEQATFETEARLSDVLGGGLFGVTVTSWKPLARRVLDLIGEKRAFLSAQGRLMLIRRCTDACQRDLTIFRRSSESRGFPAECDSLIARFKRCSMSAEDVSAAADRIGAGSPLYDKLKDIALIYSDLEERCRGRYIDSEDMIRDMISRIGESFINGAYVFIDGGDTMHEHSYPAFRAMLSHAAGVTAALTVGEGAIFRPEINAFERLKTIADEEGVPYLVTRLNGSMLSASPAIRHMERELFSFPSAKFEGEPEGLSIAFYSNRTDETAAAAEKIRAAAMNGMRFRDMAVIVSDLKGYAPVIARIFGAYGIPYFTDAGTSLASHPVALLILSALRAAERGFDAANVLSAVKSGFMDVSPEEAEIFENYLLSKGFFGSRLTEAFTDEGAPEDIRLRVMEPLIRFKEALMNGSCESRTRAIHSLLSDLDLYGKQSELCARLHEEGRFREEEENAQVINTVLEVLDQLYVIMGSENIGLKRYISVVKEGFAAHEINAIPTTIDQVLVGSVERTRSKEVRLIIVLGMNEGLFPRMRTDDGVIDDADLKKLNDLGYELWQNTKSLSDGDSFAVYSALSKAKEEIVFSYPTSIAGAGAMDSPALPCRIIGNLKEVFPLIPVTDGSLLPPPLGNEELAYRTLGRRMRRMIDTGIKDGETALLAAHFSVRDEYRGAFKTMTDEAFGFGEVKPLGKALAGKLYGRSLYGSASRLEAFNGCPFRHFIQFGLKAKERKERRQKNTDLGSFYHDVLDAYVKYVADNGLDWLGIDDEKTFAILREIVPPIMNSEKGYLLMDTARQRARLPGVIETVQYTCCAVTRHIARGSFRPAGSEISFGKPDSVFPPLRINAGDASFFISGVVDRLDSADGGMSRIVDYKLGGKDFSFAELNAGLQLQLPLYAAAVGAADTVGMYYMPITDVPSTSGDGGEAVKELSEKLLEKFRLNGLSLRDASVLKATEEFDGASSVVKVKYDTKGVPVGTGLVDEDELGEVISFAKRMAGRTLERIFEGDAAISPARVLGKSRTACSICPYGDICRFDPDLSSGGFRDIYPMSADSYFGRN